MRQFALFLLCGMLVVAFGCAKQQSAMTPAVQGTVVAKGTKTLEPGEMVSVIAGRHARPGKLVATVTWAEDDAKMAAFFRHGVPSKRDFERSGSPLVSTAYVPAPRTRGVAYGRRELDAASGQYWIGSGDGRVYDHVRPPLRSAGPSGICI